MNALRAPWTALSAHVGKCRHFLLDTADAFIDGQLTAIIWDKELNCCEPCRVDFKPGRTPDCGRNQDERHLISMFPLWVAAR
jgi:hypothetical protein